MSLYQLGIAPLSPLRRQFSSPLSGHSLSPPPPSVGADISEEEDEDEGIDDDDADGSRSEATDELTQDSRDVLVERLTDLVQRLSRGDTSVLHDGNISALHAKVDEMETVLAAKDRPAAAAAKRRSRQQQPRSRPVSGISSVGGGGGAIDEQDPFGIMSPSWVMSHFYGADSTHTSVLGGADKGRDTGKDGNAVDAVRPEPGPRKISAEVAERIVQEAEQLCAEMSEVVKSLQDRREDQDEVQEAESDLRHLRLQLKAIEVQCLQYIPPDADPELVQSIQNWKADWANLKKKWASRRSTSFEGESFASVSSPPAR
ncbi:hypothetical protein UCRPA7_892 [Phaeoacremonium minimum UCRPA7]|uniref:Uncharacterized protein n=1 Tax=Phaeoacremonium minimum (strain UCR-PA7) TaxID=1286976 RepID=R8BW12_PHAM7|nr:hypothetical protein UCRPA7_892 [Phaeoacremonium minimum UCRPA7]EOO03548.1 hypothetical protein UCRPA7_892 [Phaeoacremonium minimum UCRPA7]